MENKEDKKPKSGGKQELLANLFKKASKRERLLFYLACFAMLVVLLDRIVLIPIMRNLKSIEDKIEQKKTIIKDGLAILAYENRITEDYDRVKDYFVSVRKSQEEELADLLKEVEQMAEVSGIHLSSINPLGNIEETPFYTNYKIKLECTGTVSDVLKFVYDIANKKELLSIETFEILAASKGSDLMKSTMTISRLLMSPPEPT